MGYEENRDLQGWSFQCLLPASSSHRLSKHGATSRGEVAFVGYADPPAARAVK
jgi:hypothetical protein